MALLQHQRSLLYVLLFASPSLQATISGYSATCPFEGPPPLCTIAGQLDLYNGGTRLGIYFVWLASWIANNFVLEDYDGALDTNAIFLLAVVIAVFFNAWNSQFRVIDGLILSQISFGFICTVMTTWGYRTAVYRVEGARGARRFGGVGTHIRVVLLTALGLYNVWFWSAGIDGGLPSCNLRRNCDGIRVFFFSSYDLTSGARKFYLVVAGVIAVHYAFLFLAFSAWFVYFALFDWFAGRNPFLSLEEQRMHYEYLTHRQ
jgi:hypothetical protein